MKKAKQTARQPARDGLAGAIRSEPAGGWRFVFRRPEQVSGYSLPARPGLVALSLLLLFGLCAALGSWQRQGPRSGIDLLAVSSSPKLNITSAEAPSEDVNYAPVVLPRTSSGDAASQDPLRTEAALPPTTPSATVEPALENGYAIQNSHPGDSPMMRNWKMLAFQTMLAGTLIPASAQAQATGSDAGPKPADTTAVTKQIDDLKKSIESMERRLGDSLIALGKDVQNLIGDFQAFKTEANLKIGKAQADIDDLKKQVVQARQDLDALKNRPANRESAYTPAAGAAPAPTGRVRLVNTFLEPITVVVNGRAYQVGPNETRLTDPIPAGMFSYEVLGIQPRLDRALAANETFTITVHTR